MNLRVGQGIDFHRLEKGADLWLGGIKIPSEKGCLAHSDGDVLLHALCDAMLGACGLDDISRIPVMNLKTSIARFCLKEHMTLSVKKASILLMPTAPSASKNQR